MIPESLKQSAWTEAAVGGAAPPKTNGRNSPGSQPVAIIFNDKEQPDDQDDTYNLGGQGARATVKNDSMLFSSMLGREEGADTSTLKGNCIMSLCGPQDKRSLLLQGTQESPNGKPKVRNDKNAQRNSKRHLSSEMTPPSLFSSLREAK